MNNKTIPKDFFLHLGTTVALYAAAIALINLAFNIADRVLPDQLANYFSANSVVWPISMLVVLIPVLYLLEWLLARDISKMPEKRDIWIRRWRIYLTLFLTGATIVGDLIVLINTFLNGEVTSRFIYKVLIVLIVCAVIFAYYLLQRLADTLRGKTWRVILAWFGIVLAVGTIVGGFVIVGSPATQRALRFDNQRVSDLINIQSQIVNYWQTKQKLPASLADLDDSISGFLTPLDPMTGASYEYAVKGDPAKTSSAYPAFELCATFSLVSEDTQGRSASIQSYPVKPMSVSAQNDIWSHTAGRVCFERTIDPQKYPPLQKSLP